MTCPPRSTPNLPRSDTGRQRISKPRYRRRHQNTCWAIRSRYGRAGGADAAASLPLMACRGYARAGEPAAEMVSSTVHRPTWLYTGVPAAGAAPNLAEVAATQGPALGAWWAVCKKPRAPPCHPRGVVCRHSISSSARGARSSGKRFFGVPQPPRPPCLLCLQWPVLPLKRAFTVHERTSFSDFVGQSIYREMTDSSGSTPGFR
jgi:hypothetical protein